MKKSKTISASRRLAGIKQPEEILHANLVKQGCWKEELKTLISEGYYIAEIDAIDEYGDQVAEYWRAELERERENMNKVMRTNRELSMKLHWNYIGDRLPEVNGMYLVFIPNKGRYVRRWYSGGEFTKAQFSGPNETQITHWIELIDAPKYPF